MPRTRGPYPPLFRREAVEPLLLRADEIVVDIELVPFIDSSGVQALLGCLAKCEEAGVAFLLTPGSSQPRRLFEIAGVIDHPPFRALDERLGDLHSESSSAGRQSLGDGASRATLHHQEAVVRDELRRLSGFWHGVPPARSTRSA